MTLTRHVSKQERLQRALAEIDATVVEIDGRVGVRCAPERHADAIRILREHDIILDDDTRGAKP